MSRDTFSLLIIDQMHSSILPMLEEAGVKAEYKPEIKPGDVKDALTGFQGLMVRSKVKITEEILSQAPDLKLIARAGAGVDNIDVELLQRKNITLVNAPEGNRDSVGEHTVGMLLALLHKVVKADREVRDGQWLREENRGEELMGKTVAVIGYGNMGKAFSRRLSGFGCKVLAYDRNPAVEGDDFAQLSLLPEIFESADIVSLHIPYIPENYHFAGDAFLSSFRKPVYFLNTARGEVLDHDALVKQMRAGKVKGAALDVLENEKLQNLSENQQNNFEYLANSAATILTPHVAGWSQESYERLNTVLINKIMAFLQR